jgi:hypothetical protein
VCTVCWAAVESWGALALVAAQTIRSSSASSSSGGTIAHFRDMSLRVLVRGNPLTSAAWLHTPAVMASPVAPEHRPGSAQFRDPGLGR